MNEAERLKSVTDWTKEIEGSLSKIRSHIVETQHLKHLLLDKKLI